MEEKLNAFKRLLSIMDELRVKCPWDQEQTMLSLRNNTVEECFELTDAILNNDIPNIKKELGDLLLHIVFYSKIAEENNEFNVADVANSECEKLIYRHPHVFGEAKAKDAGDVCKNWESLKRMEKDGNKTILSGVPNGMPSLPKTYRLQEKVCNAGFNLDTILPKYPIDNNASNDEITEQKIGELLFSIINYARLNGINADIALEKTNKEFIKCFTYVEEEAKRKSIALKDLKDSDIVELWKKYKNQ